MSIDGVPSKAKVIQQRKRGFVGNFISTTKKKILKCIDRSIKKIILCNWKNRETVSKC